MFLISELAKRVGVSRTTLLYYEKLGVIRGQRLDNGYRFYTELDAQRLTLAMQLQAGGLSLKECITCLNGKLDKDILSERLRLLDEEIVQKQKARKLLSGLLGESSNRDFHAQLNELAPQAHYEWLLQQGFTEKEAQRIRWLSKDMNTHDQYMQDFLTVFEPLTRWGPGDDSDTLKAISHIPSKASNILEIGSGKGLSTCLLAEQSNAQITAIDNEPIAVKNLAELIESKGYAEQVTPMCTSMSELPFQAHSFDAILAESCVYIMGFEEALKQWKTVLKTNGLIIVSDLVWLTSKPNEKCQSFWSTEYPAMTNVDTRLMQAKKLGFEVLDDFTISAKAWQNYWQPLQARVNALKASMPESQAIKDIQRELDIYQSHDGSQFGYHFFVLRRNAL